MRNWPRMFGVEASAAGVVLRRVLLVYAAGGVLLWPVPLLNRLHAESCAVLAALAFFAAGPSSLRLFSIGMTPGRVLLWQEAALLVPLALLTVPVLWAPNCGYLLGLLFYLLFPVVTVVLAVGAAYALSGSRLRRKGTMLALGGALVAVLGPVYDLGLHPQFYTYNHVFGGVLGPIYDEDLAVRPGLFVFRGLTLLWAAFCFLLGWWLRGRGRREQATAGRAPAVLTAAVAGTAVLIGLCYLFAGRLGINTTAAEIERTLGAVYRTEHFDIYYDPGRVGAEEIRYLALDHEFHYARIRGLLDEEVEERIQSYLYPDAETKASLTGARYTNVAPVWLSAPQSHVLRPAYDQVFPHELAHVFSREFGLPGLRATLSVGLVEGLAVALEPPDGLPTPGEQVLAAALMRAEAGEEVDLAERLEARLSPAGFWTGRGAVSYATMGSFAGYLLEAYGPERLKRAYPYGDFEAAYGKPVEALAAEWERHLLSMPVVSAAAGPLVSQRFSVPSLFEVECPHYLPPHVRQYRRGLTALARSDTARALALLGEALEEEGGFLPALTAWGGLKLAKGAPGVVAQRLVPAAVRDSQWSADLLAGSAFAVLGRPVDARWFYTRALQELPPWLHAWRGVLLLRRSIAEDREASRLLASGAEPGFGAAEQVEEGNDAARLLLALQAGAAGRYDEAEQRLARPATVAGLALAEQALIERLRLEWRAQYAYRAGHFVSAAGLAEQAAQAWREVGGFNEAARLEALAAQYRWASSRQRGGGEA